MIRTKILVLRTLGGNFAKSNPRQMSHNKIWDEMNNSDFGIADYYKNEESQTYDIYDQIKECNHNIIPDWNFDDIAFIIGIYTDKYYNRFSAPVNYEENDLYPSILYPYRDVNMDFIRHNQREGIGIDIAFQFYSKIKSIKSVDLDKVLLEIKRAEFENNRFPSSYPPLCFTIDLDIFINRFLKI